MRVCVGGGGGAGDAEQSSSGAGGGGEAQGRGVVYDAGSLLCLVGRSAAAALGLKRKTGNRVIPGVALGT